MTTSKPLVEAVALGQAVYRLCVLKECRHGICYCGSCIKRREFDYEGTWADCCQRLKVAAIRAMKRYEKERGKR
jgi:hypothetical protein